MQIALRGSVQVVASDSRFPHDCLHPSDEHSHAIHNDNLQFSAMRDYKNMRYLAFYMVFVALFSWSSAKCQENYCVEPFEAYDTLTANGNFLKYHIKNKKAVLEYGNDVFRKFLPEEFDCDIADAWVPKLKYDNKNFMLLHYGCGSSCWGLIFLPLRNEAEIRKIMYDFAYDSETTNLVYTDNENLLVENLTTRKIRVVKLPVCDAANIVYCLDSISISKSELKYQFYGPNKYGDKPIMRRYIVKLK